MTIERMLMMGAGVTSGEPTDPDNPLYNWSGILTETRLEASDREANDNFGVDVAIDGNYLVIGAKSEDTGISGNGSAYVYENIEGTWTEIQILRPSVAIQYGNFGIAIALKGDYMAIGAYGGAEGAVYIYKNIEGTWTELQRLQASDKAQSDYFGKGLALSDNFLIVGAIGEDTGGDQAGAAYIFENQAETWVETQKIQSSNKGADDYFGDAVAITESYAIVGASNEDTGGSNVGSVYIFENQAGTWVEIQVIQSGIVYANGQFGWAVSMYGTTIAVGARYADTGGRVFIFEKQGATWVETQELSALDTAWNDTFGYSVDMSETTMVIGAFGVDGPAEDTNTGAAYVFELHGGTWCELNKVEPSDGVLNHNMGKNTGISGGHVIAGADRGNYAYVYAAPDKDTSSRSGIIGAMLADNPVVCYDFSEVAGTKAIDLVLGHIADHTGSPWLGEVSGVPGSDDGLAARYNTGKHTRIRAMAALDAIDTHITVEVVYKAAGWSINAPILAKWSSSFNSWLLNSYPEGWLSFSINNGTTRRAEAPLPATGVYHHIIGRYDGVNVEIWIDGIKAGTISGSGNIVTTADPVQWPEYSGLTNNNGAHESYDAVAIYDYALTDQQIANHYTATGL